MSTRSRWLVIVSSIALLVSASVAAGAADPFVGEKKIVPGGMLVPQPSSVISRIESLTEGSDISSVADKALGDPQRFRGFGFSDQSKTPEQKFFVLGVLYTDAIAKVNSPSLEERTRSLQALRSGLQELGGSEAMITYLLSLENMVTARTSTETAATALSLFHPFLEELARAKGEGALLNFQAGQWVMGVSMAAIVGKDVVIRQVALTEHFGQTYKKLNAPEGVIRSFEEMTAIFKKRELTDDDAKRLISLTKDLREFLS